MKLISIFICIFLSNVYGEIHWTTPTVSQPEKDFLQQWANHNIPNSDNRTFIAGVMRKQDYRALISKNVKDSIKVEKILQIKWPSSIPMFFDSIVEVAKEPTKNSLLFYKFIGDSTYYRTGYFKNGKKDSLWIEKNLSETVYAHYVGGLLNGDYLIYANNAVLVGKIEYAKGVVIDTAFTWYESGIIREKEFFKDGKSIWHKCFNNEGKESECLDED